jgi:hypothetical protein
MHINIAVETRGRRFWHEQLAQRLRADGHEARFALQEGDGPKEPAFASLVESRLYRLPPERPGARAPIAEAAKLATSGVDSVADLIIDLVGDGRGQHATTTLLPLFDGAPGEGACMAALLAGRAPQIEIVLARRGDAPRLRIARGLPALEEPGVLLRSFDQVCQRLCDLLIQAVRVAEPGNMETLPVAAPILSPVVAGSGAAFALSTIARKGAHKLRGFVERSEHWRIGWRRTQGDAIEETLAFPKAEFTFLPDDGARFYADPFVLHRDGLSYVFCEEFPYATGKGFISVFTIDSEGRASVPHPVLERPYHLSYPFVFERDGAVFMIPESAGNRTIELYRAESFPDVWRLESVLVDNVDAGDATLIEDNGTFWLFATLSEDGASTWDALGLFSAPHLEGPWTPHPRNPVLIDAGAARPAGNMFRHDGAWIRPAQDCRSGYGEGIALCRIDRLDREGFAQTVLRRLASPRAWSLPGLHTLNRDGPIETIDTKGWRRRF